MCSREYAKCQGPRSQKANQARAANVYMFTFICLSLTAKRHCDSNEMAWQGRHLIILRVIVYRWFSYPQTHPHLGQAELIHSNRIPFQLSSESSSWLGRQLKRNAIISSLCQNSSASNSLGSSVHISDENTPHLANPATPASDGMLWMRCVVYVDHGMNRRTNHPLHQEV